MNETLFWILQKYGTFLENDIQFFQNERHIIVYKPPFLYLDSISLIFKHIIVKLVVNLTPSTLIITVSKSKPRIKICFLPWFSFVNSNLYYEITDITTFREVHKSSSILGIH